MTPVSVFAPSLVLGFQIASQSGPLCEEPMMGVCFEIVDIVTTQDGSTDDAGFSGQVIAAMKEACRLVSVDCVVIGLFYLVPGVSGAACSLDDGDVQMRSDV